MTILSGGVKVENCWVGDLALIELDGGGSTAAPPHVMEELQARGHLKVNGTAAALTDTGRARARSLKQSADMLRGMPVNGSAPTIRGIGKPSMCGVAPSRPW